MHSCLTIVEVQHAIFREVQARYRGSIYLARLARTCRAFNNTALDILWETLPSIRYLIQCLPADLWKISKVENNREINFQRAMTNSDWEIFFKFSSRIRSLYSVLDTPEMVCPFFGPPADPLSLHTDAIIALSRPPDNGPAIPNLKMLHWTDSDAKYAPLLQSLLVCSLVDLSLPSFALRSPEMPMDLITRCVSLKSLSVLGDDQEILSETFMHLCSLESFKCRTLSEAAICSLSKLSTLVKLSGHLQNDLQPKKVKPYLVPPIFPSLESFTLDLGDNTLPILTSLLDGMRFSPREVSFSLDTPPTPDMLYAFFSALVNACGSERLTHISLTMLCDEDGQDGYLLEISLDTLEPLLALPNMESFTLDVPCNIYLDDDAIDTLTKHWPKLTQLSLNVSFGWGIESDVTHRGLIILLTRCRSLTEIALTVDFSEVDLLPYIPRLQLPNKITSGCRRANFVSSTIEYPASIAAFLRSICPRLSYVTSFCPVNQHNVHCDMGGECDEMRWERVNQFLPGYLELMKAHRISA